MHKNIILLIITILLLTGCAGQKQKINTAQLRENMSNKKVLMVIAPKDFRDSEYNEPKKVFKENGIEVKTASIQSGQSVGAEGTVVQIDLTISEVKIEDYDAVAFIGGPGMAQIVGDESLQILANKFYQAGKVTAAICVAPAILAQAGILDGKQATAWPGVKDDLESAGAVFTGDSVTVDGQVITGNGPAAAREFGEKIVEKLK